MKNQKPSVEEIEAELETKAMEYDFWPGGIEFLDGLTFMTKRQREQDYRTFAKLQARWIELLEQSNCCIDFLARFGSTVLQRVFFNSPWSSRLKNCPDWIKGASYVWSESDQLWLYRRKWLRFFKRHREAVRLEWMSKSERKKLESLRDPVRIYRGYNKPRAKVGLSWSLSKKVACKMPTRRFRGEPNPWLVTAEINPVSVIALLNDRDEQEIVAYPCDAKVLGEVPINIG